MSLHLVPVTFAEANRYVEEFHRHNGPLPSARLVVGVRDGEGTLRGVAIAGYPKARMLMARDTLEVSRCCTDGVTNGASMLYGAIRRAATALGYARLVTYTLESEVGASLRASGWTEVARTGSRSWADERGTGRLAIDHGPKVRWEIFLREPVGELHIPTFVDDAQQTFDFGGAA